MKKILAMILALVMVCSLAACGGSGEETGDGAMVSVFWYSEDDVYLSSVRAALDKEFDDAGIQHENQFAGGQQPKQIEQIKTAVVGGSDLLIVNQVTSGDPDTAKQILEAAGDIPVIFFNRAIGDPDQGKPVLPLFDEFSGMVFIGTDAPEAGHLQGKMVGEYVRDHFDEIDLNKDGKISYAMFKGDEANPEAIYRTQYGVEDANIVLEEAGKPALEYFDSANTSMYQVDQGGNWSAKAATEYMDTNFVNFNEANGNMIELVICNNDGMAEGVVASLQNKGYNKEGGHVIPVFGVDATPNAKDLIANGAMTGTVKQDAEGMALAIRQTVEGIKAGKTPAEALAAVEGDIFSLAENCPSKLYVAYQPYTGE